MRKRPLVLVVVLAALVVAALAMQSGCAEDDAIDAPPMSSSLSGDSERGRELMQHFECGRCHTPAPRKDPKSCSGCHQAIVRASLDSRWLSEVPSETATEDRVELWAPRIVHFREAPSFVGVSKLFRKDWLVRFLTKPHDLRPRLGETMPRLRITERQARDIVAYLALLDEIAQPGVESYFAFEGIADYSVPFAPHDAGNRSRGERTFEELGCRSCHWFSGAREPSEAKDDAVQTRALMLAPDLRYTRDRFQRLKLVPWLLEPTHYKKDAAMPQTPMSYGQARDLAAYIMTQPLDPLPAVAIPERLPLLARPVGYDEVREQVLDAVCIHCHSDPDTEIGDGGPGNAGGFGFERRGLNLSTYEDIFAGYIADDDERHSVFEPIDGTPVIVAALLARQLEEAGKQGRVRGMPLGLPALSPEKIQLLESWIAQGRPR